MAASCPNCGSFDVQALADRNQCLNCGAFSDDTGAMRKAGIDDAGREQIQSALDRKVGELPEEPKEPKAKAKTDDEDDEEHHSRRSTKK